MKIISFSLWGPHAIYNVGAIINVKLQQQLMPDWTCRFYVGNDTDKTTIKTLETMNCQIVYMDDKPGFQRLFWRMMVAGEKEVDRFIIQDCDSRINERVVDAIKDWESTNKPIILMRDNVHHTLAIQGGMWGGKGGFIKNIKMDVDEFCQQQIFTGFKDFYFLDQLFLNQCVWTKIQNYHVAYIGNGGKRYTPHDKAFSVELPKGQFVGQVWDEKNYPMPANRRNPLI